MGALELDRVGASLLERPGARERLVDRVVSGEGQVADEECVGRAAPRRPSMCAMSARVTSRSLA